MRTSFKALSVETFLSDGHRSQRTLSACWCSAGCDSTPPTVSVSGLSHFTSVSGADVSSLSLSSGGGLAPSVGATWKRSLFRHFARRFWNHTCVRRERKTDNAVSAAIIAETLCYKAHTNTHISTVFRLDALALSVIATATWLGGWVAGCLSQPVLYQND